jgi:hypothetical protein
MSIQDEPAQRIQSIQQQSELSPLEDPVVQPGMRQVWIDEHGLPLLPDEQPVSTVRDSLYDLIPLGPREEKLIGTAPFLRLQKIKQLLAATISPCALCARCCGMAAKVGCMEFPSAV